MRVFYLIILYLVVLVGCQPTVKTANTTRLVLSEQGIVLHVSPARLTVETPITLTLNASDLSDIQAELTGINMYMGRVPVKFTQLSSTEWQAVFLLGACTEPDMKWQLAVQLTDNSGNQRHFEETLQVHWQ